MRGPADRGVTVDPDPRVGRHRGSRDRAAQRLHVRAREEPSHPPHVGVAAPDLDESDRGDGTELDVQAEARPARAQGPRAAPDDLSVACQVVALVAQLEGQDRAAQHLTGDGELLPLGDDVPVPRRRGEIAARLDRERDPSIVAVVKQTRVAEVLSRGQGLSNLRALAVAVVTVAHGELVHLGTRHGRAG
jgi:hypothetical protein